MKFFDKMNSMNRITKSPFLQTADGSQITLYTIKNANGLSAGILDLGGIIQSLSVPDRRNKFDDVVLSYQDPSLYLSNPMFFGGIIGRVSNRICQGRFELDGKIYTLPKNDGPNNLHSGPEGFETRIWQAATTSTPDSASLVLSLSSPEGDQGYPGELNIRVTYTLDDANRFGILYQAVSSQATPLSLTNHSYFNLGGPACSNILDHMLWIDADSFTAVDENLIPTTNYPVAGTAFDFRSPKAIRSAIFKEGEQLQYGKGFDHNWVLNDPARFSKKLMLSEPASGRMVSVWTDMPGVQFYAGGVIDQTVPGRFGVPYARYGGLCLETQFPPDAVNRPDFPSPILQPGDKFESRTTFEFGIIDA
jgi:aldose 1-epimerase